MKRDIKSLLSVSLVVVGRPSSSSIICIPLDNALDVRVDDGISNFIIDVVDDYIPFTQGYL